MLRFQRLQKFAVGHGSVQSLLHDERRLPSYPVHKLSYAAERPQLRAFGHV